MTRHGYSRPRTAGRNALIIALSIVLLLPAAPTLAERYQNKYSETKYTEDEVLQKRLHNWVERALRDAKNIRASKNPVVVQWRKDVIIANFKEDPYAAMQKINAITNHTVKYQGDYHHFHKADYWATPLQTLAEGGDCEDIALLKAVALYWNGWERRNLHLVVGYTFYKGQEVPHAVLDVDMGDRHYILNNLNDDVRDFDHSGLRPAYLINRYGTVVFNANKMTP